MTELHANGIPSATPMIGPVRRRGIAHLVLGATLLIAAIVGLNADVAWLAQPFYAWVWWGYIFALDGWSAWKRGDSLLTTRRRFFFPICAWSVTFLFLFELINARIQNWYYVGVFPLDAYVIGAVFSIVAFATVFMGIFQTVDALNATGLWKNWKGRQRRLIPQSTYTLQAIGFITAGVALLFPHYLAPLVWGSFTLLVDPWNYRRGTRSLLRDFESGDFGLLARILLAGLICGVVWESLNFFAPQKWIYTVRGLENFKVFEMPLLGFLGFPALALDSMAAFAMFSSLFLGNRSWERPEDLNYELRLRPKRSTSFFWSATVVQAMFWALVSMYATPLTVASLQLELRDLELTQEERLRLKERGITRPRQFLSATDTDEERASISGVFNDDPVRLWEIRRRARLYAFKGIGRHHGRALEAIGVRSPDDLRDWEPEQLLAALPLSDWRRPIAPPRLDMVRVWILAARKGNSSS